MKIEMREVVPEPEHLSLNDSAFVTTDRNMTSESPALQFTRAIIQNAETLVPSEIQTRFYRTVAEKLRESAEVYSDDHNLAFKRICAEDLFLDHFPDFTPHYRAILVEEYAASGFKGLPDFTPAGIDMYLYTMIPEKEIHPVEQSVHSAPESGPASIWKSQNINEKQVEEDEFPELTLGLELVYKNRRPRDGISKEEVTQILKDFLTHNHKVRSNAFFWKRASEAQNPEDQHVWLRALLQHHLQNTMTRNFLEIVSIWAKAGYPEVERLNMARVTTTREQRLLEWIISWFEN